VGWVKLSEFVTGVQGVGLISGCRCVSRCCGKCVDSEWWLEEFGSCVSTQLQWVKLTRSRV